MAELIPSLNCAYDAPADLAPNPHFAEFGISDVSIYQLASEDVCVLTADGPLTGLLAGSGSAVIQYKDLKRTFGIA